MQLHDKDYFFCNFRKFPVAFEKLLRLIARHKVNGHIVSEGVVFGVIAPEFYSSIKKDVLSCSAFALSQQTHPIKVVFYFFKYIHYRLSCRMPSFF